MRKKPGLPSSFKLNTSKADLEAPAQGGSFMEETLGAPSPGPVATQTAEELEREEVDAAPTTAVEPEPADVVELRPKKSRTTRSKPRVEPEVEDNGDAEEAPKRPSPPRKQINLKPDAIAMAERLLQQIQRDSGQKDAKSSEMFTALLLALEEAASHLDLSAMPSRGAWGSRTARAFPVALKKHFIQAIGKIYEESYRGK